MAKHVKKNSTRKRVGRGGRDAKHFVKKIAKRKVRSTKAKKTKKIPAELHGLDDGGGYDEHTNPYGGMPDDE